MSRVGVSEQKLDHQKDIIWALLIICTNSDSGTKVMDQTGYIDL